MNCNLDLQLSQPPASTVGENSQNHFNPQQLTIFYNGRICVCDVTEIQARAIIWQASKQVKQGRHSNNDQNISPNTNAYNSPALSSELPISPASTPTQHQCNAPTSSSSSSGLSMKKSLQSFLQKRKRRQLTTSPYSNVNR